MMGFRPWVGLRMPLLSLLDTLSPLSGGLDLTLIDLARHQWTPR